VLLEEYKKTSPNPYEGGEPRNGQSIWGNKPATRNLKLGTQNLEL
jgi:hypothetical protein